MGTANFYHKNTNGIFSFGSNKFFTEDDVMESGLDESLIGEYDDTATQADFECSRDYCCELLVEKGWLKDEGYIGDRTYGLNVLAERYRTVYLHGVEYRVNFKAGYRLGYYEGANFDYEFEIEEYCGNYYNGVYDEIPSLSDILSAFECRDGRPRRKTYEKEHSLAVQLKKRLAVLFDEIDEEVEGIFKLCCEDRLAVGARFSNGETWYVKAE